MPDLAGPKIAYLGYCGSIDSAGVTRLCQNLNGAVNQQFDSVYLCLTSLGGYVGDGVYLFNHIRSLPIPVAIHNYCSRNAIFMMHPVAVGAQSQTLASAPLLSALEAARADEQRTESILRERTKMPADILSARRQETSF